MPLIGNRRMMSRMRRLRADDAGRIGGGAFSCAMRRVHGAALPAIVLLLLIATVPADQELSVSQVSARDGEPPLLQASHAGVRAWHFSPAAPPQRRDGLLHMVAPGVFAYMNPTRYNEAAEAEALRRRACDGLRESREYRYANVSSVVTGGAARPWRDAVVDADGAGVASDVFVDFKESKQRLRKVCPAVVTCTVEAAAPLGAAPVTLPPPPRPRRFGACVPPMYGERIHWEWLLTWLRYYRSGGLDVAYLYARLTPAQLSAARALLADAAPRLGLEIVLVDFTSLPGLSATHYGGQKESVYDCALRARAGGVGWLLYADLDEFLTFRPGEAGVDAAGRPADGGSFVDALRAKFDADTAAISVSSWLFNATACDAAGLSLARDYRGAAGDVFRRSAVLAEMVEQRVFQGGLMRPCREDPNSLCLKFEWKHQRKYLVRTTDIAKLEVHKVYVGDKFEEKDAPRDDRVKRVPYKHPKAHVWMQHIRGIAQMDPESVCAAPA